MPRPSMREITRDITEDEAQRRLLRTRQSRDVPEAPPIVRGDITEEEYRARWQEQEERTLGAQNEPIRRVQRPAEEVPEGRQTIRNPVYTLDEMTDGSTRYVGIDSGTTSDTRCSSINISPVLQRVVSDYIIRLEVGDTWLGVRLSKDGKCTIEGNADIDKAAKVLFESLCQYIDSYVKNKLRKKPEIGIALITGMVHWINEDPKGVFTKDMLLHIFKNNLGFIVTGEDNNEQ